MNIPNHLQSLQMICQWPAHIHALCMAGTKQSSVAGFSTASAAQQKTLHYALQCCELHGKLVTQSYLVTPTPRDASNQKSY
jgi:hypothetical protein